MPANYETRKLAPLRVGCYGDLIDLLRGQFQIDVIETDQKELWAPCEGFPFGWKGCTIAQIHNNQRHIGDIFVESVFELVTYEGFPQEVLEAIMDQGYLTREISIAPKFR